MANRSVAIILTDEQVEQIKKYTEDNLAIEFEEENIALFFKLMLEETVFKTFDMESEFMEIEKQIKILPKGRRFTLSDLYTSDEWKKKDKIKKTLGKIFFLRVTKDDKYRMDLQIKADKQDKNSSKVQIYEKL